MKYFLRHSLEDIAAIKVAITLWNRNDIRAWVVKVHYQMLHAKKLKTIQNSKKTEEWLRMENSVIDKVQKLPQPNILKEKILGFIKHVGLQILKWLEYHCADYLRVDPMAKLYWTVHGTIDRKRTAEALIKNENLDLSTRYILACIYCFEDVIPEIRNKMTKNCLASLADTMTKNYLHSLSGAYYTSDIFSQQKMVFFWTYEMHNAFERRIHVAYHTALKYAVESHNLVAIEHFLKKLPQRERNGYLVHSVGLLTANHHISYSTDIPDGGYADVLCFLYLQMDEEQIKEAFKNCHCQALICFLEWPWTHFFVEAANVMQDTLLQDDYFCLLTEIIHKERDGCKVLYQNLFGEFWQRIPNAYKRRFVEYRSILILLSNLFEIKDLSNIELILQDLTLEEKQQHVFIPIAIHICQKLNCDNDLDLLKLVIQECKPTKDVVIKFKEDFKKHMLLGFSKKESEKDKHKLDKIFLLLDDFACEYDKSKN